MKRKRTKSAGVLGIIFSLLQFPVFVYGTYLFWVLYAFSHLSKDTLVIARFLSTFILILILVLCTILNFIMSIVSIKYSKLEHEKYLAKKGSTIFRIVLNYLMAAFAVACASLLGSFTIPLAAVTALIGLICGSLLLADFKTEKKLAPINPQENKPEQENSPEPTQNNNTNIEKNNKRVCQYCKHKVSITEEKCPHCGAYFE